MKLTPADIEYLRKAAARDNYNPDDALKVFDYESANRPDVWGGKDNKYFGIFQAGDSERRQFGINTKNPSARNQIDAFGKFLAARGYKPGMGLLDMYSTVLAGSPGHYNSKDMNGSVLSHVARMTGNGGEISATDKQALSGLANAIASNDEEDSGIEASMSYAPQGLLGDQDQSGIDYSKLSTSLLAPQQEEEAYQPAPMIPVQHLMNPRKLPNIALAKLRQRGLLG
jgi:hypothetical protein